MLNNVTYIGKVGYKGEIYDGRHDAIIGKKLWERAQQILAADTPVKDYKGRMATLAPLKGLLYCGHCGCRMGPTYAKKGETMYTYYLCTKNSKRGKSVCPVNRIGGGDIEAAVLEHVKKFLDDGEYASSEELATALWRKCFLHPAAFALHAPCAANRRSHPRRKRSVITLLDQARLRIVVVISDSLE